MSLIIIASDTTSYPNMILNTMSEDGVTIRRYELIPADGYVIHDHNGCQHGNEELEIPAVCYYTRKIYMPKSTDLSTINDDYEAVLESTVPPDMIFGEPDNDHEVM